MALPSDVLWDENRRIYTDFQRALEKQTDFGYMRKGELLVRKSHTDT